VTCILIGSAAIGKYIPGFREAKDMDVFCSGGRLPAIRWDSFWHPDLEAWFGNQLRCATLDELYTIKLSHSAWDVGSWEKHMQDIVDLRIHGAEVIEELYDLLYGVWEKVHGRKRTDLNKDKTEFFDDAVKRKYDHDSVHYTVAYEDRPNYEKWLVPGETVKMDFKRFWQAPESEHIMHFREEIYATALERIIIPSDYTASPRRAYAWALKRTVTSLTKGRSSRFIAERYGVFRKPDVDYVGRHKSRAHLLVPLPV
jgi:hypothetical protein